jgi:hypothetical protein
MTGSRVIEIPLPDDSRATVEDVELLESAFQALVSLRFGGGHEWESMQRCLESRGWSVSCGLRWHVEARRGREVEEACGKTRDDAFRRLYQTAHVASVEGCP